MCHYEESERELNLKDKGERGVMATLGNVSSRFHEYQKPFHLIKVITKASSFIVNNPSLVATCSSRLCTFAWHTSYREFHVVNEFSAFPKHC
jgi:hypothetical protein